MRIRKNKKLTASMIWSTAASASSPNPPEELMQSHVCVVNRSPWDAPLSPALDYPLSDDFLPSSPISSLNNHHHHHQAIQQEQAEDDDIYPPNINGTLACDVDSVSLPPDDNSIESMKISSEKSSMSMSHSTIRSPTPSSPAAVNNKNSKEKEKASSAMGPPKRRGRPKKVVAQPQPQSQQSNPNEFYYYSGFGPRWGKRRGTDVINQVTQTGGHKRTNNAAAYSSLMSGDEPLDYIDDEDDDDDDTDDEVDGSRKRTRKPVKARSLKSLM